ncbi:MAG: DivIVA domain-containing protein [Acidimicrobiales bacterium]
MDLTPDVLRGIEFRRKGRGYDIDDVDAFREQVEVWVGEAQTRLREATTKLDEAEKRAREAEERSRTNVESDETIQRTLLLAQRTADSAVAEAEETAGRKVAEAEAEAERLTTEARTHRERAIADAEAEVREAVDLKRAELLDELTALERDRDALADDVALLETHIEAQRGRVQEARDVLGVLLDDPGSLALVTPPTLSATEVPVLAEGTDLAPATEPDYLEDLDEESTTVDAGGADPWAAPVTDSSESVFGETHAASDDDWSTASEDAWADTPPPPPPPPPGLDVDEAAWADAPPPPPPPPPDFDVPGEAAAPAPDPAPAPGPTAEPDPETGSASFGGLSGPAVPEQLPELDEQAEEDNPWLAELSDQETEAENSDKSRFGRRH